MERNFINIRADSLKKFITAVYQSFGVPPEDAAIVAVIEDDGVFGQLVVIQLLEQGRHLDIEAMATCAAPLLGLHDFAAYCKPREGATTIRDLQRLDVRDVGDEVIVDVTADAFCHSMVRSLMGALTAVASGRRDRAWLRALLTAPCPIMTFSPIVTSVTGGIAGEPEWITQLSSITLFCPTVILPRSPRITAPGQTEQCSPKTTSPITYAAALTNADSAILGVLPLKLFIMFTSGVTDNTSLCRGRSTGGRDYNSIISY